MKVCFFITPIGDEGSEIRLRSDKVYNNIIKPICEKMNYNPIRVDLLNHSDSITTTIIEMLSNAALAIADISGHNPNVFFEIGYRTKSGLPMIFLREKDVKIPFDIANIRVFDYDLSDWDSVFEIRRRLEEVIKSFTTSYQSDISYNDLNQIIVDLQSQIKHLQNELSQTKKRYSSQARIRRKKRKKIGINTQHKSGP